MSDAADGKKRLDLSDLTAADFVSACDADEPAPTAPASPAPGQGTANGPGGPSEARAASRFLTFQGPFGWDLVPPQAYKQEGSGFAGITRHVLFGPGDETHFHVRYFEVAPGGYTTLEKHQHAHAVICVRGRGEAVVGQETRPMNMMDAVYVAGWTPHQFLNAGDEPFGFICVVDADRDRPQPPSAAELATLKANPTTAKVIRLGEEG